MKTVINIKADKEVKEKAAAIAREIGIPLSTVINAFLKKFISEKSVTFTTPLKPSKSLAKTIAQAEKDIAAGRNLSPFFVNMKKMDEYLDRL